MRIYWVFILNPETSQLTNMSIGPVNCWFTGLFIILPFCSIFVISWILVYFYWWIFYLFVFFIFIPINIFLVNRFKNIYFWDLNRYVLKSCISSNLSVPFGLFWCLMCFFIVKILSLLFTKSHKYLPINNIFYNSPMTKFQYLLCSCLFEIPPPAPWEVVLYPWNFT